jgi:hypothetical protein
MEHRGVEYAAVQTLSNDLAMVRETITRSGRNFSREDAIRHAEKFIDQLIKDRTKPKE